MLTLAGSRRRTFVAAAATATGAWRAAQTLMLMRPLAVPWRRPFFDRVSSSTGRFSTRRSAWRRSTATVVSAAGVPVVAAAVSARGGAACSLPASARSFCEVAGEAGRTAHRFWLLRVVDLLVQVADQRNDFGWNPHAAVSMRRRLPIARKGGGPTIKLMIRLRNTLALLLSEWYRQVCRLANFVAAGGERVAGAGPRRRARGWRAAAAPCALLHQP